jgi:hypothetical protein
MIIVVIVLFLVAFSHPRRSKHRARTNSFVLGIRGSELLQQLNGDEGYGRGLLLADLRRNWSTVRRLLLSIC